MTFRLLLWFLITLSIGYLIVDLLLRRRGESLPDLLIDLCLGMGIGAGVSSCIFFVCLLFSPPLAAPLFAAESAAFGLLLLLGWNRLRLRIRSYASLRPFKAAPRSKRLLLLGSMAAVVIGMLSIAAFLVVSFNTVHGEYDGWEIWNMRARFLFRGGSQWTDAFSNLLHYSHPDYPLLLSATIARSWLYMGSESQAGPISIAMAFTFGTVALLSLALLKLRSRSQGLLAGAVLLGTPFFIAHGASQYADVPLGFYLLATLVLLSMHEQTSVASRSVLILAGMAAGFAAWTKNEGLLFLPAVLIALGAVSFAKRGWKNSLQRLIPFLIGVIPVLLIIFYFKVAVAPANDLISGQGSWPTIERLLAPSRYYETGAAFAEQMFRFGNWHRFINMPVLLVFYLLLVGIDFENHHIAIGAASLAIMITAMGYFAIYIVTPRPLEWHLTTSLNRLYLQLWPSFLFTYFLIVRRPEKAILVGYANLQPAERSRNRQLQASMPNRSDSHQGVTQREGTTLVSND